MTLTEEERRDLAALRTNKGFAVLIGKCLEPLVADVLLAARRAGNDGEKLNHYRRYEALVELLDVLKTSPADMERLLADIGDEIYG